MASVNQALKQAQIPSPEFQNSSSAEPPPYFSENGKLSDVQGYPTASPSLLLLPSEAFMVIYVHVAPAGEARRQRVLKSENKMNFPGTLYFLLCYVLCVSS